jgi:hemerythrin
LLSLLGLLASHFRSGEEWLQELEYKSLEREHDLPIVGEVDDELRSRAEREESQTRVSGGRSERARVADGGKGAASARKR